MDVRLAGRRILVTGGTRGIGRAIVTALTAEGAHVALCARSRRGIEETVGACQQAGVEVIGESVDVTVPGELEGWVDSIHQRWDSIDGLVSNVSARVYRDDIGRWVETFQVDLLQHVRAIETVLPHLRASSGSIVVIGSVAATMSELPELDRAYGPMKAALASYVSQVAQLEGRNGVRANVVSPGPIHVDDGFWGTVKAQAPEAYARAASRSVFGRLGRPEEVAAAAVFLLSPLSSFTTSANLRIDGGLVKVVHA